MCDSTTIHCGARSGDEDDEDGLNGENPDSVGCGGTFTVSQAISRLDQALCQTGRTRDFYARLACLAECVNSSGREGDEDGDDNDQGDNDAPGVAFQARQIGSNPVHMTQVSAVHFQVTVPGVSVVTFRVYDAAGRLVAEPLRERAVGGQTEATWDGRTLRGTPAPSGTYFYRMTSGTRTSTGRFLIVR